MAPVNHSSFKTRRWALWFGVLSLAGCAGQSELLGDNLRLSIFDKGQDVRIVRAEETPVLKPTVVDAKSDLKQVPQTVITPASAAPEKLPRWCVYLKEDTAAQTAIVRSPTLSGSIADDGKSSISLGMSLSDYAKAGVMEESAEARCRRYMAESGLQKLVFLSPQGLTSAGFKAKAKSIGARKSDIQALRRQVAEAMANGFLDRDKASVLMGAADQLLAEAASAKSQAERRTTDLLGSKDRASLLGKELMRAEADLEDLNSRLRTFDAIDVSVSAGWSDDVNEDNFAMQSDAFSGKVSVSMKLGAVLPQRFEHERRAKEAKVQALAEEGGALWQVNVLRLAHERAIAGLVESSTKIDSALAETRKMVAAMQGIKTPELQGAGLAAKFRMIQLQADKAAVDGSIAEIRTNLKRLKTQS